MHLNSTQLLFTHPSHPVSGSLPGLKALLAILGKITPKSRHAFLTEQKITSCYLATYCCSADPEVCKINTNGLPGTRGPSCAVYQVSQYPRTLIGPRGHQILTEQGWTLLKMSKIAGPLWKLNNFSWLHFLERLSPEWKDQRLNWRFLSLYL